MELTNPLARLSRTETRGKPFSCLGELCWYLAGSDQKSFIEYYIPRYSTQDQENIFGAYGPRLLDWNGVHQLDNIANLLSSKRTSRQAVIQLFDARDILQEHEVVPCTSTLQFLIREGRLHMLTVMRSNDAFLGLPHDFFAFTMIQEIMARRLAVDLGTYKHFVGSLHLYDCHENEARAFLDEGWQSTQMAMPPMPSGSPLPAIEILLRAEASIRRGETVPKEYLENLDPYWVDLILLLQVFRLSKVRNLSAIKKARRSLSSPTYFAFVDKKLSDIS